MPMHYNLSTWLLSLFQPIGCPFFCFSCNLYIKNFGSFISLEFHTIWILLTSCHCLTSLSPDFPVNWLLEASLESSFSSSLFFKARILHRALWWTGRPGILQFMGSQRVRHDWATELNWTPEEEFSCGALTVNLLESHLITAYPEGLSEELKEVMI